MVVRIGIQETAARAQGHSLATLIALSGLLDLVIAERESTMNSQVQDPSCWIGQRKPTDPSSDYQRKLETSHVE